uniref:Uncharacterized protein n=1 Tax=Oryza meridionalis TaxID=40149 RepID=A0A0E0D4D1_9ORYZ
MEGWCCGNFGGLSPLPAQMQTPRLSSRFGLELSNASMRRPMIWHMGAGGDVFVLTKPDAAAAAAATWCDTR